MSLGLSLVVLNVAVDFFQGTYKERTCDNRKFFKAGHYILNYL